MNNAITPEINTQFTLTGCRRMPDPSSDLHYYHHGADLYLRYSLDLPHGNVTPVSNATEVVIVVPDDDAVQQALRMPDYPCQVVILKDLAHFLLYRAFNHACLDHRIAQQSYAFAQEKLEDAILKHEDVTTALQKAKESFDAATDAFLTHKKPPFYQVTHA